MKPLPIKAKILIAVAVASGLAVFAKAMLGMGQVHDYPKFLAYLLVSVAATRLRVSLPRMTSSMSVNLPFILIALIELSLPEALMIAAVSTFVQSFWPESKKRNLVQVAFNVSVLVVAAQSTWLALRLASHNMALAIVSGTLTVLLANTLPVAAIIGITEAGHVARVWAHIVQLTFPYYGLAAGIAGLVKLADHAIGWQVPLLILPAMLLVYRSYKFCFRQMSESAPVLQARAMSAGAGAH
jgi:hypothetical protein